MSAEWGLIPLGMDETDLVMLILALFILSVLVIAMFVVLHLFYAILGTLVIIFGIMYGVRKLQQEQDSRE